MNKTPPKPDPRRELRRKAEAYLRQNPTRGPAVFKLPEQLAIVDLDSQQYPYPLSALR